MRLLSEGTRLADRYALIRRLGSGGMSEVWLARDRQTESVVALKFISGDGADAGARERLRREWQIGSRLMHAHILRIFEYHDDPDGPFYSMQYLGGVDLGALAGTPLDNLLPPIALVADALRYAHAKGVVHRDIKASNVLLDARGAPYLTDFGVASLPAVDAAPSGGSPIAMGPGQRAGSPARPADDIYALGILICELISGAPPGESRPLRLEAPDAVKALLEAMLADDPERRPDAAGVARRLADAGFPGAAARKVPHEAGELPAEADVAVA
ncbi:MAG: serine/threonine-protein kinase, partial [Woeseiaceae bacterium]